MAYSDLFRTRKYSDVNPEAAFSARMAESYFRRACGREDFIVRWGARKDMKTTGQTFIKQKVVRLATELLPDAAPFTGADVDHLIGVSAHESGHVLIDDYDARDLTLAEKYSTRTGWTHGLNNIAQDMLIDGKPMELENKGIGRMTREMRDRMRVEQEPLIAAAWAHPDPLSREMLLNLWGVARLCRMDMGQTFPALPHRTDARAIIDRLEPYADRLMLNSGRRGWTLARWCEASADFAYRKPAWEDEAARMEAILQTYTPPPPPEPDEPEMDEFEDEDDGEPGENSRQNPESGADEGPESPEDDESPEDGDDDGEDETSGEMDNDRDPLDAESDGDDGDDGDAEPDDPEDDDGDAEPRPSDDDMEDDGDGDDAPEDEDDERDDSFDDSGNASDDPEDDDEQEDGEDDRDAGDGDPGHDGEDDAEGEGEASADDSDDESDAHADPGRGIGSGPMPDVPEVCPGDHDSDDELAEALNREIEAQDAGSGQRRGATMTLRDVQRATRRYADQRTVDAIAGAFAAVAREPIRTRRQDIGKFDRRRIIYADARDDIFTTLHERTVTGRVVTMLDMSGSTMGSHPLIRQVAATIHAALAHTQTIRSWMYAYGTDSEQIASPEAMMPLEQLRDMTNTNAADAYRHVMTDVQPDPAGINLIIHITDGGSHGTDEAMMEAHRAGWQTLTVLVGVGESQYEQDYARQILEPWEAVEGPIATLPSYAALPKFIERAMVDIAQKGMTQ